MAQKVTGYIRLQIDAAKATASPTVGPALGQHGVNISQFIKEFNERTKDQVGYKIPVVITVYADRSFTFITKTPPTATLILKAVGLDKASGRAQQEQGRHHHQGSGEGDCGEENARPQRRFHRSRYEHGRRAHAAAWVSPSRTDWKPTEVQTYL